VPKRQRSTRFASRGGDKLAYALDAFGTCAAGAIAADLGASVGGFTDCLIQRGAQKVYAVDTAYGILAWGLRQNPRVVVMERCNALHLELPEPVSLVVADVGWTPLARILPVALGCLTPGGTVVALLKPQYESAPQERERGVVSADALETVISRTLGLLEDQGIAIAERVCSPLTGAGGNREFFVLVRGAE